MSKVAVYVGAVVAFLVGLGIGAAVRAPAVTVTIAVIEPSAGVRVEVDGEYMGTTDAAGQLQFIVRARANEQLQLVFRADHYSDAQNTVTVWGESLSVGPVSLQRSLVDVDVNIVAFGAAAEPLAAVGVSINGAARGVTSAEGKWEGIVSAPYGAQVRVSIEGVPQDQAFDVAEVPVHLVFESPAGVAIRIKAKNGVPDVEISHAGVALGHTDAEGVGLITIPVGSRGVTLSFRLSGARIADWRIPDNELTTAGRELTHTISVRPTADIQLNIRATKEDDSGRPAVGYEVQIGGRRVAVTEADGTAATTVSKQEVLLGERVTVRVQRGAEGIGTNRFTIGATKLHYTLNVTVAVPKIVRLALTDEAGRGVPKVKVKIDGAPFATSNNDGIAEGSVSRLNVEYRFTFHREGYVAPELSLMPKLPMTDKLVVLKALSFLATFVDSLTGTPVEDLEIWYDGSRLLTTIGQEEVISIPRLGRHEYRLDSQSPRYPRSQNKTVNVPSAGTRVRIEVAPRLPTFSLTFKRASGGPVPNRQVDISGRGYRDQKRTDSNGQVSFGSYMILEGSEYKISLIVGTGSYVWTVPAAGYEINRTFTMTNKGTLTLRASGGSGVKFELYLDKTSLALRSGVASSGQSPLVVTGLEFRDYEVLATSMGDDGRPMLIQQTVTVDSPVNEVLIDTEDPYRKGVFFLERGDTTKAMERFRSVPKLHLRFSDAQTELCFYHNQRGEFYEAYGSCRSAVEDPSHQVNPYLYLACSQASHRQKDFDRGITCAQRAFTHFLKAKTPQSRRELREQAQYLEALCLHDRYFEPKDPDPACEQKRPEVEKVLYKWQSFVGDVQDKRDAAQRIGQCEGEILSLPCI